MEIYGRPAHSVGQHALRAGIGRANAASGSQLSEAQGRAKQFSYRCQQILLAATLTTAGISASPAMGLGQSPVTAANHTLRTVAGDGDTTGRSQEVDPKPEATKSMPSASEQLAQDLPRFFPGITSKDIQAYIRDGGNYEPSPLLQRELGTPAGVLTKHSIERSTIFPGSKHDYWVYVPKQYRGDKPVCVMVFLDGESFLKTMPPLLDNLIQEGSLPPVIGIFTNSGVAGPGYPIYGGKGNRAVEYDMVNGRLASFLDNEILSKVRGQYNISNKAGCHGILGLSSGGSAAFGVGWHRPDLFGRVVSIVGSFVNIAGADAWPSMVRRAERKPLRVWMQSGSKDLDTVFGNWPLANQQMASALAYREYDFVFEFGEGGHNLRHFLSEADDVLRWLWRDVPADVRLPNRP
ncbi:alpha/beta hydrolase [Sphingosinicella microcystinivorans]|nr:alpha/beta hydrolase-fold protein [Sphingosinicella microcystinivorans]